ncbi:MAG: TIR domain-containing protein [Clostridiales bacterium]|nr:TIR domain-containing protein [Clostridiales bacterium]
MSANQNDSKNPNSKYSYYAFISYKHEDVKAAKWLQKKLQNYRLPSKLAKEPGISAEIFDEDAHLPHRLSPIFRDQTDLTPGNLGTSLKKALASSRFLIIICSKAAHDSPEYLNYEIEHFLSTGHTIHQVIPFIIDKESNQPELDCFPPALQVLTGYDAVLGANVRDNGWNDAFLKVVATMLGVQLSAIKNLDDIRKRRHRVAVALACCFVVVLGVLGYIYYDKTYVPKIKYYANYIEVNGVAEGVYEIEPDDISLHNSCYAITTVNDIVKKVEYFNSCGTLIDYTGPLHSRYATIEYIYRDKTILYQVNCYDSNGVLEQSMQYDEELKIVQLHSSTTESTASNHVADLSDYDTPSVIVTANITRYICDYDENGFLTHRLFAVGDDNKTIADSTEIYGYAYTYCEDGLVEGIYYLGIADSAETAPEDTTGSIGGINSVHFLYENGVISMIAYFDEDDNLVNCSDGWATCMYGLNENGIQTSISYYDPSLQLISCSSGYASVVYTVDGAFVVEADYFDEAGDRTSCIYGYAICLYDYDDSTGLETQETYYDENLKLTECDYGYAVVTQEFLEDGRFLVMYYDAEGNPTDTTYGYSMLLSERNENGLVEQLTYIDSEGNVLYVVSYNYDGTTLLERSYSNEDGEPFTNSYNYTTVKFEHDDRGNTTGMSFYNADGKLCAGEYGYASTTVKYNDYGNMTYIEYRDEDNELVEPILKMEYDEQGRRTYAAYYDDDGELVNGDSYASITFEYTEKDDGYTVLMIYEDANRNHVAINGFAAVRYAYDLYGNIISKTYYDESMEVISWEDTAFLSILSKLPHSTPDFSGLS